jgi:ATP-dependent RNA helicase SUPV3L1/SUV3
MYDVAVIDEIQMMGDRERGNAWTHALLSVCASEVHLCGEATVVDLVRRITEETGDEFIVNHYQRLTPLTVSPSLNGDLSLVTKGDCVVTFSRSKIFALKQAIELKTGLKCAVAYGRLPPEVRSEQAQRFNDPESDCDIMVASDAIGMGLNLCVSWSILDDIANEW